jgi:hypothetical protein
LAALQTRRALGTRCNRSPANGKAKAIASVTKLARVCDACRLNVSFVMTPPAGMASLLRTKNTKCVIKKALRGRVTNAKSSRHAMQSRASSGRIKGLHQLIISTNLINPVLLYFHRLTRIAS